LFSTDFKFFSELPAGSGGSLRSLLSLRSAVVAAVAVAVMVVVVAEAFVSLFTSLE